MIRTYKILNYADIPKDVEEKFAQRNIKLLSVRINYWSRHKAHIAYQFNPLGPYVFEMSEADLTRFAPDCVKLTYLAMHCPKSDVRIQADASWRQWSYDLTTDEFGWDPEVRAARQGMKIQILEHEEEWAFAIALI